MKTNSFQKDYTLDMADVKKKRLTKITVVPQTLNDDIIMGEKRTHQYEIMEFYESNKKIPIIQNVSENTNRPIMNYKSPT